MSINNENLNIVAAPSYKLILQWILNGELWRLGWGEDPDWGKRPIDQILIKTAIFELAGSLQDEVLRRQLRTEVVKGMETTVERMMKEAEK